MDRDELVKRAAIAVLPEAYRRAANLEMCVPAAVAAANSLADALEGAVDSKQTKRTRAKTVRT